MNTAATPTATAARASTGTNSRSPPLALALPARLLHRMGGVEHHRIAGLGHDRQGAHVGDQRVVAEAHAALAQQDVLVAGLGHFLGHVLHVPGRQELALLDVDGAAWSWPRRPADRSGGRGRRESAARPPPRRRARIARAGARRSAPGSRISRAPRRESAGQPPSPCRARSSIEVRLALSKEVL